MESWMKLTVLATLLFAFFGATLQQPTATVPTGNTTRTANPTFLWTVGKRAAVFSTLEASTTDAGLRQRDSGIVTVAPSLDATNSTLTTQNPGGNFTGTFDSDFTTTDRMQVTSEAVMGRQFPPVTTHGVSKTTAATPTPVTSITGTDVRVTSATVPGFFERNADITTDLYSTHKSNEDRTTTSPRHTTESIVLPFQGRSVGATLNPVNATDADEVLQGATHQAQNRDDPPTVATTVKKLEDVSVTRPTHAVHRRQASTTTWTEYSESSTPNTAMSTSSTPAVTDV